MQHNIFHSDDKLEYIHTKKRTPIEKAFNAFQRTEGAAVKKELRKHLDKMSSRHVLISNENISMSAMEPWVYQGPTPESFCQKLNFIENYGRRPRVIIAIRRQDQWLASRYAESARKDESFNQEDFEKRLVELSSRSSDLGALSWLDYSDALTRLKERVGEENLLVLPMERIVQEPCAIIADLEGFLGVTGWLDYYEKKQQGDKQLVKNALSLGDNIWRMRRRDDTLTLSDEAQEMILKKYEATNRQASDDFSLELERYGYF